MKNVDGSIFIYVSIGLQRYGFKLDPVYSVCVGKGDRKCILWSRIEDRRSINDFKIIQIGRIVSSHLDDANSDCITVVLLFEVCREQLWIIFVLDEPEELRVQIILLPHIGDNFGFYQAEAAACDH